MSFWERSRPREERERMATELLYPEDIDRRLSWPLGTAARLARRQLLPHYRLPDGSLRLRWEEIAPLVRRVPRREQHAAPPHEEGRDDR